MININLEATTWVVRADKLLEELSLVGKNGEIKFYVTIYFLGKKENNEKKHLKHNLVRT